MRIKSIKHFLRGVFEIPSSTAFKTYQPISISIVLLSIVFGVLAEFNKLHQELFEIAYILDYTASIVIGFEYISRWWLVSDFSKDFKAHLRLGDPFYIAFLKALKPKLQWMVKPTSIIDLISIFPLYHPLRLVRIIIMMARFFKISLQYKAIYETFISNIMSVINEIIGIVIFIAVVMLSLTIILFSVEKMAHNPHMHTLFDAFYMAMITATTVGYGDVVPITTIGRIVAIIIALLGWLSFSILTAFISSGLIRYINLIKTGGIIFMDLQNHIIIAGWTEATAYIVEKLKNKKDKPLIVVISNHDLDDLGDLIYKKGDFIKEHILKEAKIEKAKEIIILPEIIQNLDAESIDARSMLTAVVARGLNKDIKINLQLLKIENARTFRKRNIADSIIVSGEILGDIFIKDIH